MRRPGVEEQIAELSRFRTGPCDEAAIAHLRKGIASRINLVSAKAAEVAGVLGAKTLIPDLLAAFERYFREDGKHDPQCWAKNAVAKALTVLDYDESAVFLRGCRYSQWESVWGSKADTALTLRSLCILALVQCADLPRSAKLRQIVASMTDAAETVRIDAIRALEQMDGEEAPLLLRLKAGGADKSPRVVGQALESLLELEGESGVEFARAFLDGGEELAEEAALALGASRLLPAVEVLTNAWRQNPRPVLLQAISTSRLEAGLDFLLDVVANGRERDSAAAVQALSLHRDTPELRAKVEAAMAARARD